MFSSAQSVRCRAERSDSEFSVNGILWWQFLIEKPPLGQKFAPTSKAISTLCFGGNSLPKNATFGKQFPLLLKQNEPLMLIMKVNI